MEIHESLVYGLGITMLEQIGPARAKQLIAHCGSMEHVFTLPRSALEEIPVLRPALIELILNQRKRVLEQARWELDRLHAMNAQCVLIDDLHYPQRLKECDDSPIVLYYKGQVDFNPARVVSVVGTRRATSYGRYFCEQLMEAFAPLGVTIISGLAFGIDGHAHRAALERGLPTQACVAHGLHTVYPSEHAGLAKDMQTNGGLVSEFTTTQRMCAELFPMRNRLIAGMSDATVVVESDLKGGSMITAYLAHSYHREVFALPGRINERSSAGCNALIQRQVAHMVTEPGSIIDTMNWSKSSHDQGTQLQLFQQLSDVQQKITGVFNGEDAVSVDQLIVRTGFNPSVIASELLAMEFSGLVRSKPGNRFELLHRSRFQALP